MAMNKEEYALKLMPDFDVFDIVERNIINNDEDLIEETFREYNLYSFLIFKKDASEGITITRNWFRIALRSTRELELDDSITNCNFITVQNPSDGNADTPEYFYYVIIFDIDYIEKTQTCPNIKLKFKSESAIDTEIVGVVI